MRIIWDPHFPFCCWLQDLVGSAVVGVLICIRQMPAMEGRCQHFCVAPLPGTLQPGHVRGHVRGHVWGHVGQLTQLWKVEYDHVQKLADPWRSPAVQAAGVLSSSSVLSLRTDVGKDCQPSFIRNIHSNPKTLTFQSPSLGCNIQCWFSWLAIVCVPNCLWLHAHFTQESCPNFAFFINDSVAFLLWVTMGELQWESGQIVFFNRSKRAWKLLDLFLPVFSSFFPFQ